MNEAGATGRQRGAGSGERASPASSWLPSLQEPHRVLTGVPSPRPRPGPGRLPGGRDIFLGRRNSKLLSGEWRRSPNLRQKCRHHVGRRGRGQEGEARSPTPSPSGPGAAPEGHRGWGAPAGGLDPGVPPVPQLGGTSFPCPDTEGDPSHQGLRKTGIPPPPRPALARRPQQHRSPRPPGDPDSGSRSPPAPCRPPASESVEADPGRPQALRAACRRRRRRPAGSCPPLQAREAPCKRELDS